MTVRHGVWTCSIDCLDINFQPLFVEPTGVDILSHSARLFKSQDGTMTSPAAAHSNHTNRHIHLPLLLSYRKQQPLLCTVNDPITRHPRKVSGNKVNHGIDTFKNSRDTTSYWLLAITSMHFTTSAFQVFVAMLIPCVFVDWASTRREGREASTWR
jgi:hypothetical protein